MNKAIEMLATLLRRPNEFLVRMASSIEIRLEPLLTSRTNYDTEEWDKVLSKLGELLGPKLTTFMGESALKEIENTIHRKLRTIPAEAPFPLFHNGDFRLGRLCYVLARALEPDSVLETGVCYGVSSAFILKALEQNGRGTLYSIDMPPLGSNADRFVGWLIPQDLRQRWQLFLGPSKDLLPKVTAQVGALEMFLHDSKHTYWNIRRELQAVKAILAHPSVVVADDVEGNAAFLEWAVESKPAYWATIAEENKRSLLGVAAFAEIA